MIRQRINAGLVRAKKAGKRLGRPRLDPELEERIRTALREGGKGIHKIAQEHGVGSGSVQRIKAELAGE